VVVVEAHSKASNILTLPYITALAEDPTFERPLALHPIALAGLEMQALINSRRVTEEECAGVVVKNKHNATRNPSAAHGMEVTRKDVLASPPLASPLTSLMAAPHADGALVFVLAETGMARTLRGDPVRVRGVGWATDTPALDSRDWTGGRYARRAAEMAYRVAGVHTPGREIDFAEVDDCFAHKELLHLEALGLVPQGRAGEWTLQGQTAPSGSIPVNVSGGALGEGSLLDATGLSRALEVVLQLRGQAGMRQLPHVATGLAFGWRGLPTAVGVAAVLSA
jgi:acetyl-CoA C-acetyltransferase